MNLMNKLERKLKWLRVPNLMIYITATMLAAYALEFALNIPVYQWLVFDKELILQGQVWRLFSFVVLPPTVPVPGLADPRMLTGAILSLYFCYFVGTSLEDAWGEGRFTIYYVFGVIGSILSGFITGGATNQYLNLSLFFAFARLFPNLSLLLFWFLPVKVKYLAAISWGVLVYAFIIGNAVGRVAIAAAVLNYILFFGPDILKKIKENMKYSKSRREFRKQMAKSPFGNPYA